MGFLAGKRALIIGLANNRSIAYGIAEAMHREGAELAFNYQVDKLKTRVEDMAKTLGSTITIPCDLSSDEEIDQLFIALKEHWGHFDILVHSVGFAPADQLDGDYIDCVNREGFRIAHDISSYSFAALAKGTLPFMEGRNASMLTMSYLGAEKAVPNYNVMGLAKASLEANVRYLAYNLGRRGIRVNAVSAGPIRTLASAGIKGFRSMLNYAEKVTPIKDTVSKESVGNTSAFLCSDLAAGITGEIVHVDNGFHMLGMAVPLDEV